MPNSYTAIVKKQGRWWISWVEEAPGVNCQVRSRGEVLDTLRVSLKEASQHEGTCRGSYW